MLSVASGRSFAAELGGKPEKTDIVVTYAQPSGAFTPIWVAYDAGLFKKYGLNASLQLLTPQVSAQAVIFRRHYTAVGLSDLGSEGDQVNQRSERKNHCSEHTKGGIGYRYP
jgi:ABC-type nitrate/sulfonate/bicarbonate transport system substrate-binding protein